MSTLDHAIVLATRAHSGQIDRAGEPYILHPLRVMLDVEGEDERVVAVLHDVVEDTEWTLAALKSEGFSSRVLEALEALTRLRDEDYFDYVSRAQQNPLARTVKVADLRDNLDPRRLPEPAPPDIERFTRYRKALAMLVP